MMRIRTATHDDLPAVLELLNTTADWVHSKGLNQWPNGFDETKIGPLVDRTEVLMVHDGDVLAATIAASHWGDVDFWTDDELTEPATYVTKAAIDRSYAGRGLGDLLFRWVTDMAALRGDQWVRLDAWRTNTSLHDYYRRRGWTYLRTVNAPHRNSGALFARPASPDNGARDAFLLCPPQPPPGSAHYAQGDRVMVLTPFGPAPATITTRIEASWGQEDGIQIWENVVGMQPPVTFTVQMDDGETRTVDDPEIIGSAHHH